jgi:hypothetical protein
VRNLGDGCGLLSSQNCCEQIITPQNPNILPVYIKILLVLYLAGKIPQFKRTAERSFGVCSGVRPQPCPPVNCVVSLTEHHNTGPKVTENNLSKMQVPMMEQWKCPAVRLRSRGQAQYSANILLFLSQSDSHACRVIQHSHTADAPEIWQYVRVCTYVNHNSILTKHTLRCAL